MNTSIRHFFSFILLLILISCKAPGGSDNTVVLIKTSLGDLKIKLYENTPVHRDNFVKLVNMGFYEGVSFHRVIKDFMIQTGDPATRPGPTKVDSDTLLTYTLPAEFLPAYYHKKGAVAAAREGNNVNPAMRSSGTQFYIVQGIRQSDDELNATEGRINNNIKQSLFSKFMFEISDSAQKKGAQLPESELQEKASVKMFDYLSNASDFKFSDEQKNIYKTIGGVPRLDGTYTVFGEVIEGLEILDKIASLPTNNADKPLNDVRILKMKIISK